MIDRDSVINRTDSIHNHSPLTPTPSPLNSARGEVALVEQWLWRLCVLWESSYLFTIVLIELVSYIACIAYSICTCCAHLSANS